MSDLIDNYLNQTGNSWQWKMPEQFNITEACVSRHVRSGQGQKIALIVEDHEQGSLELSYRSLEEQSSQFAATLAKLGVAAGERVLIRLPNSCAYPISFFGCLRHGAIAVPTSTLLAASEVSYLAKDSGAKVLIAAKSMWQELAPMVEAAANEDENQLTHVLLAGPGELPENLTNSKIKIADFEKSLAEAEVSETIYPSKPGDPAYLVYTSGTTGFPKGVLHAHRALIGRLPASRFWFDFKPGDRIMHSGKFNWTYVLGSALMDPLFHGHTVIVHEGPNDASTWPQLIKKHACTIFIGVPTIYRQIIQKTDFSQQDVPSLRHCMSAGEHLSDEMLLAWRKRFAMDVYEAIGMSEFSYYISQHRGAPIKPGAAGFPQPGHSIQLLNGENQPVAANEEGMIAIPLDDPGLFLEYWQLADETAEACRDGYFFTGDYARIDEEGYIWFLGRKDDIINTFGYRVSPHEIERVIKTHPDVADCVALGETISTDKTLVSICVILAPNANTKAETLLAFGQDNLAKYKAPKIVHFFDDFPRTKNGKVLRKELTAQLNRAHQTELHGEQA